MPEIYDDSGSDCRIRERFWVRHRIYGMVSDPEFANSAVRPEFPAIPDRLLARIIHKPNGNHVELAVRGATDGSQPPKRRLQSV
jgi:hypothetical protein